MRRSSLFIALSLVSCGTIVFAAPYSVFAAPSPCGALNTTCCPPGDTCNAGLTCQSGLCVQPTTPNPMQTITLENPLGTGADINTLIAGILAKLVLLGAPIAGVMVLIGGFQMIFSHGDPEKFALGKKTLLYTAIGYGIILLADGVGLLIQNLLTP